VSQALLPRLEKVGIKTFIDFRDFEPGAPKPTETERAIVTSRKTILVLTPAYLTDGWDEFQNLLLQTLDPANQQRRLLPLIKEACDLPPRLNLLTPVNFADPELAPLRLAAVANCVGRATRGRGSRPTGRCALELADEWQKQVGRPNARDYVRTHWLLGAAHRVNHDLPPLTTISLRR